MTELSLEALASAATVARVIANHQRSLAPIPMPEVVVANWPWYYSLDGLFTVAEASRICPGYLAAVTLPG